MIILLILLASKVLKSRSNKRYLVVFDNYNFTFSTNVHVLAKQSKSRTYAVRTAQYYRSMVSICTSRHLTGDLEFTMCHDGLVTWSTMYFHK